jgi:hypothetical protein
MTVTVKNLVPAVIAAATQTTQYTAVNVTTIIDKFTATNYSAAAATIGRTNNITWTAGSIPCANFNPGTTQILLYQQPSGGGAVAPIAYDATGYIIVSGTYTA